MAAETAPAFFAPGNHEVDSPCWPELRDGLEAAGVQVLEDRAVLRNFRGEAVNLEGLWDLNHDPLGQAHARETLPERIRVLCREGALNVLPVSYTHLDVYKRQLRSCGRHRQVCGRQCGWHREH